MKSKASPPRIKASLELALLGLIAEQHPRSGYDLVQTFRISMSHYWHAHPGQIYPTLDRMERDGWIAGREVIQRGRPNKRVYSITAEGRRILLEWLQSPYEPLKMKNPPLLRSRFLGHLGADGARAKFAEVRDAMTSYLEVLRGYDRVVRREGRAVSGRQPDVRLLHTAIAASSSRGARSNSANGRSARSSSIASCSTMAPGAHPSPEERAAKSIAPEAKSKAILSFSLGHRTELAAKLLPELSIRFLPLDRSALLATIR